MEHIEVINKIIEAEQRARSLAEEVYEKRRGMHTELETATTGLRESYMERAKARIDKVRERESAMTGERLAELDASFRADLKLIEEAFESHKAEWADKLFTMIVRR